MKLCSTIAARHRCAERYMCILTGFRRKGKLHFKISFLCYLWISSHFYAKIKGIELG